MTELPKKKYKMKFFKLKQSDIDNNLNPHLKKRPLIKVIMEVITKAVQVHIYFTLFTKLILPVYFVYLWSFI